MSYKDYLLTVAQVSPDALPYFNGRGYRNNMRVDTVPALVAAFRGAAGFDGLGLDLDRSFKESSYAFHFPDGGASVARLLCKRIVPRAFDGEQNHETIVTARLRYERLDEESASVRIRLNSTVVRVQHEGSPDILNFAEGGIHEPATLVRVAYMKDGKVHGVRARNCVLACYNSIVRFLAPELPDPQKEALAYPAKVPLVYSSVFIRNWRAFHKLGIQSVSAPNMWHTAVGLDQPVSIGEYKFAKTPDEPTVLHLSTSPNKPGLPRKQQHKAGWHSCSKLVGEGRVGNPSGTGADPRSGRIRSRRRYPRYHGQSLAPWVRLHVRQLERSRRTRRRTPARSGTTAVRTDRHRQQRCGGGRLHERSDRSGPPSRR
jgi:hypothetical protein